MPQHIRSSQSAATRVVGEAMIAPVRLRLPSNRSFAWVMTVAWSATAALLYFRDHGITALAALALAAVFAVAGTLFPAVLTPLNRLWMAFGALLGRIVTPLVMGVVFFAVVSPIAVLMRRVRNGDPLHRTFEPGQDSYWIRREVPGPDGPSMKQQF